MYGLNRHDICQISYTSVYPTNMKIYPTKSSINIFEITVKICSLWDILPTGEIILQKHCLCQISCLKISKYVDNPPQKCMKCHGNFIYCIQCHYFLQIKHILVRIKTLHIIISSLNLWFREIFFTFIALFSFYDIS